MRLLEKGLLTKENLIQEADKYKKEDDSKDDFGSDFDDLDDLDGLEPTDKAAKKQANKSSDKPESGLEEEDQDDDDDEFDDDEDDYDDEEEEEEEEWKSYFTAIFNNLKIKQLKILIFISNISGILFY